MNICRFCDFRYYIAAKQDCNKKKDTKCTPLYDFEKDDDVLNCEI